MSGPPIPHYLLGLPKFMSIESVIPPNHLILCCPLLLLPSIFPSIRVFSNELTLCIRWPKYWSFNFRVILSSEHSGLISFRTDWLDLLAVQGTLKSLLQHHSSKASILGHSAFLMVLLSHPYMTTGKTMPFNTLSRWGRSPGEGNTYPLQYPGLENSMDCIVYGIAKSWTRLSKFQFHFSLGLS